MADTQWQTFKGTNFEVGKQLGCYWVRRLKACEKSVYGRRFLRKQGYKEFLQNQSSQRDERLFGVLFDSFSRKFPLLLEELEGMAAGANDAGYDASPKNMFLECLGDVYQEVRGCSTVARRRRNEMVLAHNEEDDCRYPLCYAKVHLRTKDGNREFLSVSYPFQFFGTAVGANSALAFTGNSIGMDARRKKEVRHSLAERVPKTVFSRLMLEQESMAGMKRLLKTHHAVLPCHWYVANRSAIRSVQIRPTQIKHDPAEQLSLHDVREENLMSYKPFPAVPPWFLVLGTRRARVPLKT